MELRPLKTSLKTFSDTQQKTIEDATRGEFERNKLNQKIGELETELRIARKDTEELSVNYKTLVEQKNTLMQQLSHFEKDSFEIQARVRRGIEAEREVETKDKNLGSLKDKERDLQRKLETT